MNGSLLVFLLAELAVFGSFWIGRRALDSRTERNRATDAFRTPAPLEIVSLQRTSIFAWFAFMAIAWAAISMADSSGVHISSTQIIIRAEPMMWLLPAVPLGVLFSIVVVDLVGLQRRVPLEDGAIRVEGAVGGETSLVSVSAPAAWARGIFAVGLALTVCLGVWEVRFDSSGMEYRGFAGFGFERQLYSDMQEVVFAPAYRSPLDSSRVIRGESFAIRSVDGSAWSSLAAPADLSGDELGRIVAFVEERTGLRAISRSVLEASDM